MSPYVQLFISDTTSIVPLSDAEGISLPESYQQVELTVQEQQYPAWSDPMAPRYYVLNALNTRTGETHLYQYDTDDGTYQYFIAPEQEEDTTAGLPIPGKIGEMINEHLVLFFAAVIVLGLILFILMIVFAVKLVHRNQELDDLYDEYDIPFEDEENAPFRRRNHLQNRQSGMMTTSMISMKTTTTKTTTTMKTTTTTMKTTITMTMITMMTMMKKILQHRSPVRRIAGTGSRRMTIISIS